MHPILNRNGAPRSSLDRILSRLLRGGCEIESLLGQIAAREPALPGSGSSHLDDVAVAALWDGDPDPRDLAHLIACDRCAASIDSVFRLAADGDPDGDPDAALDAPRSTPVPTARLTPPTPAVVPLRHPAVGLPSQVLLSARVRTSRDGSLEVTACSGATRIQGALAVRGESPPRSVGLRDRDSQPRLELSVLPGSSAARISLLVRWLGDSTVARRARAICAGRVIADVAFEAGSALIADLRPMDVRVEILSRDDTLGTAWLCMEVA